MLVLRLFLRIQQAHGQGGFQQLLQSLTKFCGSRMLALVMVEYLGDRHSRSRQRMDQSWTFGSCEEFTFFHQNQFQRGRQFAMDLIVLGEAGGVVVRLWLWLWWSIRGTNAAAFATRSLVCGQRSSSSSSRLSFLLFGSRLLFRFRFALVLLVVVTGRRVLGPMVRRIFDECMGRHPLVPPRIPAGVVHEIFKTMCSSHKLYLLDNGRIVSVCGSIITTQDAFVGQKVGLWFVVI